MTGVEERDDRQGGTASDRWRLLWLAGALVLLAAGAGVYWLLTRSDAVAERQAPVPPLVETATARQASELVLSQTAFLRPRAEVTVAAEVQGRIRTVGENFRLGEQIGENDLLFALETEDLEADVEQAEARVEQARATLAQARVARGRQEELRQEGFTSEADLEETIVSVASADADLANAQAGLTQARNALADADVRAPFDALVTAESAAEGARVQPGTTLGTLVDVEAAELKMGLTPADLDILGAAERAVGGTVSLRGTGAKAMALGAGTLVGVDPRIVEGTRTVALIVEVPRPFAADADAVRQRPLRIDELVEVALPVSARDRSVVEVPPEAVKGQNTVWVVEDGSLRRTEPTVLLREESRVLLDGRTVPEGTRVLVSDLPAALDGMEVRVAEEDADDQNAAETAGAATPDSQTAGD